jgi:hypothetical protein
MNTDRFSIAYKQNQITIVRITHRVFDIYINGIPRICRNTPAQGIKEAQELIDQGFGPIL